MEVGNSSRKFFGCPAADGTKAANQGYALAQFNLGNMFYNANDYGNASIWYEKAAYQGHTDAQRNLGAIYLNEYAAYRRNEPITGCAWIYVSDINDIRCNTNLSRDEKTKALIMAAEIRKRIASQ